MYASFSALVSAFGITELSMLLSDEEPLISEPLLQAYLDDSLPADFSPEELAAMDGAVARVTDVITQQSLFMDGYFAKRYELPLTADVIANTPVTKCCLVLSRCDLADDANNHTETMQKEQDRWLKWLSSVSRGDAVLPGAKSAAQNTGEVGRRYPTSAMSSAINWDNY